MGVAEEQAVAIDGAGERLRLTPERVDDVMVVDHVDANPIPPAPAARVADDVGSAEPGLDAVIVDMDAQPLADEAGRSAVEDLVDEEAASASDPGKDLGEIGRPLRRQRAQGGDLGAQGLLAAAISPGDELVDEAAEVIDGGEVAAAAQDQRLIEGGFEMAVMRFDRAVLVGLAAIVAAGDQTVVATEGLVAPGDVLGLVTAEIAEGG